MNELHPEDPLFALLDTFTTIPSDIEERVMAQVAKETDNATTASEVAVLRDEVNALRAEIAELKRILLAPPPSYAGPATETSTRGRPLLPYAHPENALSILN